MHDAKTIEAKDQSSMLGFWIYLMTDCLLFGTLFATFAVLRNNTNGGAELRDIIQAPYVLVQTLVLLTSSFTCSMAVATSGIRHSKFALRWLIATIVLGATFLTMELVEFSHLVSEGDSWKTSAALSSFFTLVGTHGLHITIGLLWSIALLWVVLKKGFVHDVTRKLRLFSMYWHFLDVVWICVFTVVYLRGIS